MYIHHLLLRYCTLRLVFMFCVFSVLFNITYTDWIFNIIDKLIVIALAIELLIFLRLFLVPFLAGLPALLNAVICPWLMEFNSSNASLCAKFDERINCFLLVITLTISFNQCDYGYIEKLGWFRTICIDDPEDDLFPFELLTS